ncbi:MAG TPA: phenylalanine--tRNA ligase subunit beta [Steroidobacteraceae bacterium]|nr:phenylalanine--tRNA ligase subunit beta [Steroidobacteraceae bacterium]
MRISFAWLSEWVNAGLDPAELAARLTMSGLEVESIEPAAGDFTGVVVGEVLSVERHPGADKLTVCQVAGGGSSMLQVVCGAPNVRAGMKAPLALEGAKLAGGDVIRRARLRGVESSGMLCSARELGLSEEHEGIVELPDELVTGSPLRDALALDDTILTLAVTPNRGDVLSVQGVAREVAAITARKLAPPGLEPVPPVTREKFAVRLEAPSGCPRFAGRVIRGVNPSARTPLWMRERLRRAGLRPIRPVVDVTNYVMLELGQPLHAYDLRRLTSHVEVRKARPGEQLALLDGREVALDADTLVIADGAGPVGIAGVMGGEKSGIAADTADVFLEGAFFPPDTVAGVARRFGLVTDAAQRFERGVDPRGQERAVERASELLLAIAGGRPGPTVLTQDEEALPRRPGVTLRPERVASLLGAQIPRAEIEDILRRLGMQVAGAGDVLGVIPPSWRFDIAIEQDLIEEVGRIHGFDNIPRSDAKMPQRPQPATERAVTRERLRLLLADRGYQEVITYSFVDPRFQRRMFPRESALVLANPLSTELSAMRVSLWPGLVDTLRFNQRRQQGRVRIFEVGTRFEMEGGRLVETQGIAGLVTGAALPEQWGAENRAVDFYDLKSDVEALFAMTGRQSAISYVGASHDCLHPGRSAAIHDGKTRVGWIGQLQPELARALDLRDAPFVFELGIDPSFRSEVPVFREISKFPAIRRDLAVVVDETVTLDELKESVNLAAKGLLRELAVFDVYRGKGVEPGRKSIALGLILQETSRTLTDEEADAVVAAVIGRVKGDLKAGIRE